LVGVVVERVERGVQLVLIRDAPAPSSGQMFSMGFFTIFKSLTWS
jgi:hypothetical protein